MNNYIAKKHKYFFMPFIFMSVLLCWTLFMPLFLMIWAFIRWKSDTLEIKDGCLYSRTGFLHIDKKAIPLDKISMINIQQDILAEKMNMGVIEVQSSAFGKSIKYPCIENPQGFVDFFNKCKQN